MIHIYSEVTFFFLKFFNCIKELLDMYMYISFITPVKTAYPCYSCVLLPGEMTTSGGC